MNLGGTIHITKIGFFVIVASLIILTIYFLPSRSTEQKQSKLLNNQINLKHMLLVAMQAAENGGKAVVNLLSEIKISSKGKTKEGANDSVTTADFHSHCIMTSSFKQTFPTVEVISEESVVCNDQSNQNFLNLTLFNIDDEYVDKKDIKIWIDPLDATQEYTEKLTNFVTTMVCITVKGKPIIGVIHKPFEKSTYWAWVAKGHSNNLAQPKISKLVNKYKFIVSRSHMGEVQTKIHKMFKDKVFEIVRAGGAGYKVLEVISGNADIYIHVTAIKKWDICAGNALLNAFGGTMTTLHGEEIDYSEAKFPKNEDGIIASILKPANIDFN